MTAGRIRPGLGILLCPNSESSSPLRMAFSVCEHNSKHETHLALIVLTLIVETGGSLAGGFPVIRDQNDGKVGRISSVRSRAVCDEHQMHLFTNFSGTS